MDWYKAKTILIAFLITTNILLLFYIVTDSYSSNKTKQQITDTVINILDEKNITVDKSILLSANTDKKVKNFYASNIITNYPAFSKLLLGEDLTFSSYNSYQNNIGTVEYMGDYFNAKSNDGHFIYKSNDTITKSNATTIAKSYLKHLGADINNLNSRLVTDNNNFSVTLKRTANSLTVFDMEVTVEMNKDGIYKISGSMFNIENKDAQKTEQKNISGVLIEYMNKLPNNNIPQFGANVYTNSSIMLIFVPYSSCCFGARYRPSRVWPPWRESFG